MPGFGRPNKMNRGYFGAKPLIGGSISFSKQKLRPFLEQKKRKNVRIGCRWGGVVRKAEPIPVSSSPFVQQPLVCAIPRSLLLEQIHDFLEFVFPG